MEITLRCSPLGNAIDLLRSNCRSIRGAQVTLIPFSEVGLPGAANVVGVNPHKHVLSDELPGATAPDTALM